MTKFLGDLLPAEHTPERRMTRAQLKLGMRTKHLVLYPGLVDVETTLIDLSPHIEASLAENKKNMSISFFLHWTRNMHGSGAWMQALFAAQAAGVTPGF